jgi:hypothetical protein
MTPDTKQRAGAAVPAPLFHAPASQASSTRRVRLIKTHIHAGLPHKVGDEIDLLHDLADWLIAEGAAEAIAPEPEPASASTTTTQTPTPAPTKKDKSA